MSHRSWRWVACGLLAVLCLGIRAGTPVAAQRAPIEVIFSDPALRAGDYLAGYLAVDAPPTGEVRLYVDGLGVLWDSFVLRFLPQHPNDCFPPEPFRCNRCPEGRRCFTREMTIDPRTPPGHYELPVTIVDPAGRTTSARLPLDVRPPRDADLDGLPDVWENTYFGWPRTEPGFGADGDPDGDGVNNLEEYRRDTNPVARYTQYFAEGSSGERPPAHSMGVHAEGVEPGANVWVRAIGDDGRHSTSPFGGALNPLQHQADRVVAFMVESVRPLAAFRGLYYADGRAAWDTPIRTPGVQPSTRWYFADGGTDGTLDTFYLTYNPTASPVVATITYRFPNGRVARQSRHSIQPGTRTTIWTNVDDAALGRVEASTEVTATAPIVVERSWRFDPQGRTVTQQLASPGTDRPSTRWIFPDVDGEARFEASIVIANAAPQAATVEMALLFADRSPAALGQVRIPPFGRTTVPVRQVPALARTRASLEITSVNGAPIVAERTFSGRDADGTWRRATAGARAPARRWVFPQAQAGTSSDLIITNLSRFDAQVEVHFAKSDSYIFDIDRSKIVVVPARGRFVYPVSGTIPSDPYQHDPAFPITFGRVRVTSQPTARGTADIVVEAMSYGAGELGPRTRADGVLGTVFP